MDTLERLRQVTLFATLTDEDRALLEGIVRRVEYPAGEIVYRQGAIGDTLFIVDDGELAIIHVDSRGRERTLDTMRAGATVGENALLLGEPYQTTLKAETHAALLAIHRDDWSRVLNEHPDLRERLVAGMSAEMKRKLSQRQFRWLMRGETLILVARKHWWAFAQDLPVPITIFFAVLITAIIITAMSPDTAVTIFTWALAVLTIIVVFTFATVDWRNDLYVVTNRRVLHLERVLIFREYQREAQIEKIQSVALRQPTLIQKIVGVSDVLISTAALHGTITFANIRNGAAVREKIFEQMQRTQAQQMFESRAKLKSDIRNELEHPFSWRPPLRLAPAAPATKPKPPPLRQRIRERFSARIERDGAITWRKNYYALFRQQVRPFVSLAAAVCLPIASLALTQTIFPAIVISFFLFLFAVGLGIWELVDWSNDIYMVTPDRIVNLERTPLGVTIHSVDAPISTIQNVSYIQPTIISKLLNTGRVLIETAGQTGQMIFLDISAPADIASEILARVEGARERERAAQFQQQRAQFLQWLGAYHDVLEEDQFIEKPKPEESASTDEAPPEL
jgi:CRP-like cAMP-binding protein